MTRITQLVSVRGRILFLSYPAEIVTFSDFENQFLRTGVERMLQLEFWSLGFKAITVECESWNRSLRSLPGLAFCDPVKNASIWGGRERQTAGSGRLGTAPR